MWKELEPGTRCVCTCQLCLQNCQVTTICIKYKFGFYIWQKSLPLFFEGLRSFWMNVNARKIHTSKVYVIWLNHRMSVASYWPFLLVLAFSVLKFWLPIGCLPWHDYMMQILSVKTKLKTDIGNRGKQCTSKINISVKNGIHSKHGTIYSRSQ